MKVTCRLRSFRAARAMSARTDAIVAATLIASASAWGQDISGRVVDKLLNPVPDASVCVQGGSACARTSETGAFRLRPGTGSQALGFRTLGFALERTGRGLSLTAPRPSRARLAWVDAQGQSLAPELILGLSQGPNAIPAPERTPPTGLAFLRLRSEGSVMTWKCLWGIPQASSHAISRAAMSRRTEGSDEPLPAALSKAPAPPILEATKAGFGRRTYVPEKDVEVDVQIMLPAEGEVALFDGRTLDGWKGTPGWWKVVDGAIHGKGTSNGLLVTDGNYSDFRLFLRSRNVNGKSHMGICFWGKRDPNFKYGECTLVMPHDGGQWDYHAGEGGVPHQSPPPKAGGAQVPDQGEFYYTEILASRARKTIMMETEGIFMVNHRNKEGLTLWDGPIGLQIHDGTIELEHKDIFVEVNPKQPDRLLYLK